MSADKPRSSPSGRSVRVANLVCAVLLVLTAIPIGISFWIDPPEPHPTLAMQRSLEEPGLIVRLVEGWGATARGDAAGAATAHPQAALSYLALWVCAGFCALVLLVNVVKFGVDREDERPLSAKRGEREGEGKN